MASAEVAKLRTLVNEDPADSEFKDSEIQAFLDQYDGNLNLAAAHVWRVKAGKLADLVTLTEGSSTRHWSSAYKQALEMASVFESRGLWSFPGGNAGSPVARMRKIVRS